jgi:hypothetical protein
MPERAARSWMTHDGLREASPDGERSLVVSTERRATVTRPRPPRPDLGRFDVGWAKAERGAAGRGRAVASSAPREQSAPRPAARERAVARSAPREGSYSGQVNGKGLPGRRTVVIRGEMADRHSPRRRPQRSRAVAAGYYRPRPERAAKWAVLLGFLLVVVALVSAHL